MRAPFPSPSLPFSSLPSPPSKLNAADGVDRGSRFEDRVEVSFHFSPGPLPPPSRRNAWFSPAKVCSPQRFTCKLTHNPQKTQPRGSPRPRRTASPPSSFEVFPSSSGSRSEASQSESPYFRNAAQSGCPHLQKVSPGLLTRQAPGPIRGGSGLARRQSLRVGSSGRACTWPR